MQAKNRYIELRLPDMEETTSGLVVDGKQLYGPIAEVISVGDKSDAGVSVGDWIVFYPELLRNYRIKGVVRNFIVDDGIIATLPKEEAEAPYNPVPKIEVVKGDPRLN